jgi:chorismate-pyruvate lyase
MDGPPAEAPDAVLRRFVAQREREGDAVDFTTLPPFGRCLLVTDGNVTTLIEAYALEQVRTRCVDQKEGRPTPGQMHCLAIGLRTPTVARRVTLEGNISKAIYLTALTLMVPARLPPRFINELRDPSASIGAALISAAVEHRRELLWFNHVPGTMFSRTYRIFVHGRPALLIAEDFHTSPLPGPPQPSP